MPPKLNQRRCQPSAFIFSGSRQSARTTSVCAPAVRVVRASNGRNSPVCLTTSLPSTQTVAWWLTEPKAKAYWPASVTFTVVRYQATEPRCEMTPPAPVIRPALGT
jgi:hypothetical protein